MGGLTYQTTESSARLIGQATEKPSGYQQVQKEYWQKDREFPIELFEKEHEEKK